MAHKNRTFQLFEDGKVIENSAQKRSLLCFEGVCETFISSFPRLTTLAKGKQCKTWPWNKLITIYVNKGICCIQSWYLILKSPGLSFYMIVRRYMLKYCRINLWLCILNSKLLWNIKVSPLAFDLNNKIRIWSPTGLLRMILYQVWNKFIKANYRISFFFSCTSQALISYHW